jgi:hypothetical protein
LDQRTPCAGGARPVRSADEHLVRYRSAPACT